ARAFPRGSAVARNQIPWTPERRQLHGLRSVEGKAERQRKRRLLIAHVDDYRQRGQVAPELAPIVAECARWAAELVSDLGGYDQATAAQLALVDQATQAAVIRAASFRVFARDDDLGARAVERFNAAANVERSALALLGLERRAKPVQTLAEYL